VGYYFFAASLPSLSIETPPPLSFERFLALCTEHLSSSDRAALDDMLQGRGAASAFGFVRAWANKETQIRNAVVRHRATRARQDAAPHLRPQKGVDLFVEKRVSDAFARPSPAERELALDRLRWTVLDELAGFDPFTGPAILSYALKLKLAGRWAAMDPEKGRTAAEQMVNRSPETHQEPANTRG